MNNVQFMLPHLFDNSNLIVSLIQFNSTISILYQPEWVSDSMGQIQPFSISLSPLNNCIPDCYLCILGVHFHQGNDGSKYIWHFSCSFNSLSSIHFSIKFNVNTFQHIIRKKIFISSEGRKRWKKKNLNSSLVQIVRHSNSSFKRRESSLWSVRGASASTIMRRGAPIRDKKDTCWNSSSP